MNILYVGEHYQGVAVKRAYETIDEAVDLVPTTRKGIHTRQTIAQWHKKNEKTYDVVVLGCNEIEFASYLQNHHPNATLVQLATNERSTYGMSDHVVSVRNIGKDLPALLQKTA